MSNLYCRICNEKMRPKVFKDTVECSPEFENTIVEMTTLVGFISPKGHDHDDNCLTRFYICSNNHEITISKIKKCPVCEWTGKKECFCHRGMKVEEWPDA